MCTIFWDFIWCIRLSKHGSSRYNSNEPSCNGFLMWLSTIKFCHFNFIVDSVFLFVCRDNLFSSRFIRCYFHWVHSRGSVVVAAKLSRSRCHFSYGLLFSFCSHIAILVIQTQWKCIWKIIFYFVNFLFATCHRIFDFLVAVLPILLFYMIILVYMFCGRYLEILFCWAKTKTMEKNRDMRIAWADE